MAAAVTPKGKKSKKATKAKGISPSTEAVRKQTAQKKRKAADVLDGKSKKEKKKKDPDERESVECLRDQMTLSLAAKRPPNAYSFFNKKRGAEIRKEEKAKGTTLTVAEVSKIISPEWSKCCLVCLWFLSSPYLL